MKFELDLPELVDKVKMDQISNEFETWPDQIFDFRVTYL